MNRKITILAGEPEYDSHKTMRAVAKEIADTLEVSVDFHTPNVLEDTPDFGESSFGDLTGLSETDLLIVYTRFRRLPDKEMEAIQAYLDSGRSIIGLRTSSHAFQFDSASRWFAWNEWFGSQILGSPWISHHGHSSTTDVTVLPDAPTELVTGLPIEFQVRSWLYRTELAPWCRPILTGVPVDPESESTPGPVAWIGTPDGRRTFYTSLGHRADLELDAVRTLLLNASRWALDV